MDFSSHLSILFTIHVLSFRSFALSSLFPAYHLLKEGAGAPPPFFPLRSGKTEVLFLFFSFRRDYVKSFSFYFPFFVSRRFLQLPRPLSPFPGSVKCVVPELFPSSCLSLSSDVSLSFVSPLFFFPQLVKVFWVALLNCAFFVCPFPILFFRLLWEYVRRAILLLHLLIRKAPALLSS